MIKYLIVSMLFTSPCLAGMGISGFPYPGPGVLVAASGSGDCNPLTDYVGDNVSTGGTSQTSYGTISYTFLFTPTCSGPLNTAYLYKSNSTAQTANMGVYLDDGDSIPDSGDTLVAYVTPQLSANTIGFNSGSLNATSSVSTANKYWLVFEPSSAEWQYSYHTASTSYYKTTTFNGTWPATLPNTWITQSRRPMMYVSIGN